MLDSALTALLGLNGPSVRVTRSAERVARFEVLSVRSKQGQIMMPLTFALEVELFVTLDETCGTYAFSGRSFESNGFSMSSETFRGVYRRKEWGKHLTWDGVVPVKFDTGVIFDAIEHTLQPLGWRRA